MVRNPFERWVSFTNPRRTGRFVPFASGTLPVNLSLSISLNGSLLTSPLCSRGDNNDEAPPAPRRRRRVIMRCGLSGVIDENCRAFDTLLQRDGLWPVPLCGLRRACAHPRFCSETPDRPELLRCKERIISEMIYF